MRRLCVLALALGLTASARCQTAPDSFTLTAGYDRAGLPIPHWMFRIVPGGMVEYTSHHAAVGVSDGDIRFQMSRTGLAKLGRLLAESHGLSPCETKTKGLARMGDKVMTYTPTGGVEVRCAFNYTDNKSLGLAAEYLSQVSYTLEEGVTIDSLHRYDRLGLDPVLTRLAAAAKDGKAPELAAIATSLQALVADDALLERVRLKAAQLLEAAKLQ